MSKAEKPSVKGNNVNIIDELNHWLKQLQRKTDRGDQGVEQPITQNQGGVEQIQPGSVSGREKPPGEDIKAGLKEIKSPRLAGKVNPTNWAVEEPVTQSQSSAEQVEKKESRGEEKSIRGISGWVSPEYTESRAVTLNPRYLLQNRCVGIMCGTAETECYKVLRTRIIQKTGVQGGTTIMVTSALPGEGKTLMAINLALTLAKEFKQTVLLVDGDLRKQKVQEYLGFRSGRGLVDYLVHGRPLSDLIVWPKIEKFTVISGGVTTTRSSELLASPRMGELVKDLKNRYPDRFVLFDLPPVLSVADALAFAPLVDHIIFVVRAGVTPLPEVRRAIQLLPQEKILGLVLNRAEQPVGVRQYYIKKKETN